MPTKPRYTVKQVSDALKAANGFHFLAAQKLGCDADTITNYKKRYPEIKKIAEESKGRAIDLAESKLLAAIKKGAAWAICFFLKTQGKDRGYSERHDFNHSGRIDHGIESMTDEQLESIAAGRGNRSPKAPPGTPEA